MYSALAAPLLVNESQIVDTASNANGVFLKNGGTVENSASAVIQGELDGIFFLDGPGTVSNAGSITADHFGVFLSEGGTVLNTGSINGGLSAISFEDGGSVTNTGKISGASGVYISGAAGNVSNSGTITGTGFGVWLEDGGTVTNTGTIAGTTAVYIEAASGARVVAGNGAVFLGTVKAEGAGSTLEFTGNGETLASISGQFIGFETIAFDPGAAWGIEGDAAQLAALTTITGHPGLIDLTGFAATVASYTDGIGLVLSNATSSTTLHVGAGAGYRISGDGNGGTDIRLPYFITASTVGLTATPFNEFYVLGNAVTLAGGTVDPEGLLAVGDGGTVSGVTLGFAAAPYLDYTTSYTDGVNHITAASDLGVVHVYDVPTIIKNSFYPIVGATLNVYSGGTAYGNVIAAKDTENVYSGATDVGVDLTGATFLNRIKRNFSEFPSHSVYNYSNHKTYPAGDVLFRSYTYSIGYGGTQNVRGGTVINATIQSYADQNVLSGTVTNSRVYGTQSIYDGTITNPTLFSGAIQNVFGGTVTNETGSGGTQNIHDGTVTTNGISGKENVYGGTVTNTGGVGYQFVSGGRVTNVGNVGNGQSVHGGTVTNEGIVLGGQKVYGGTITQSEVQGNQELYTGATVSNFTLLGNQTVYHGVYAKNITFGSGDTMSVNKYFQETNPTGGTGHDGATVVNVSMVDGNQINYGGVVINTTITGGGRQIVGSKYLTQDHGPTVLEQAGVVINSTLSGVYQRLGGAYLIPGFEARFSGYAYSYGTGTAIHTVMDGGTQAVGSGIYITEWSLGTGPQTGIGTIKGLGTIVGNTATYFVAGPGYALDTTLNNGEQIVHLTGTVTNTELNYGTQNVEGGVVIGTTLNNSTQVLSFGQIYYPEESFGGQATFIGGTALDTVINNGGTQEVAALVGFRYEIASVTNTTINSGGVQIVEGGLREVEIANFSTVNAGGKQYVLGGRGVLPGGFASNNTVFAGGAQYVGGNGTGTAVATSIFSGGMEVVNSAGTALDTTLFAGGLAQVTSGGTIAGATIDGGTLQLEQGATLAAGGTIFEPGYVQISSKAGQLIAVPDGTYGGGITFAADGAGGLLELTAGASIVLDAPIYGFTFGDTIDLAGFTATSDMFVPGTGLTLSDGTTTQTLDIAGSFTGDTFALGTNANGSVITLEQEAACFVRGTRILTASGALVPVEELCEGDEVEVFSGEPARILWIGRRTLAPRRHKRPETVQPILITAGALGYGVPWRDLLLSPDHALYLEHHLIPAKTLINGFTIRQLDRETVTYYHIELPEHAALFAEGAAAESYLETGNRGAFENGGGAITLHPDFAQTQREQKGFAPFTEGGPLVEGIRRRILDRANIATTHDPALKIEYRDGCAIIRSRHAIPGLITPDPRDRRRLGVKIAGITIGGRNIPFDHPALADGWHDAEPDGRWTDGNAIIPAEILGGARDVTLHLAATLIYPITPPTRENASRQASR